MSNVTKRGPVKPSLNITPLIDVVFLLIVFFLLVNKIVTEDVPNLKLPELEKPVTIMLVSDNRLIINVVPEDEWDGEPGPGSSVGQVLNRRGTAKYVRFGGVSFDLQDADSMQAFKEAMISAISRRDPTDLRFLLRVDAAVYYDQVLPVMDMMQTAMFEAKLDPEKGQTMIDIVAYMPD